MAKKTSEEFVCRALENVQDDRDKLLKIYDLIEKSIWKKVPSPESDEEESQISPDAIYAMAASEHLTRIMDCLTKQTSQVIELARIKQRSEISKAKPSEEMTSEDFVELYNAIDRVESSKS